MLDACKQNTCCPNPNVCTINNSSFTVESKMTKRQPNTQVVKVGKLLATINVTLKDKATGRLCAQGRHIKFIQQEPFSKGKTPKALLSKM